MVAGGSSRRAEPGAQAAGSTPVSAMVESIVGCKWSVRLLGLIAAGTVRPSGLLRACPGLSAKVMNERLRKFTRFGIARREVRGEKPPVEVEYLLTPFGERFIGILEAVWRLQEAVDDGIMTAGVEEDQKPPR
jgi:DNA-binding HxlR family transcriptional regulator